MALDVNRWLHYAKARIERAVGQGNEELDRLEAAREVELADKPWLRADGDAPTLDEARARIEWEAEHQRTIAAGSGGGPGTGSGGPGPQATTEHAAPAATGARPAPTDADAEQAAARLELERREQASAARLARIREELGVAAPPEPPDASPPGT